MLWSVNQLFFSFDFSEVEIEHGVLCDKCARYWTRSTFSPMFYLKTLCHFLVGDKRGEEVGFEILVTKSDNAGRGSKMTDFSMASLLKGPLVKSLQTNKTFSGFHLLSFLKQLQIMVFWFSNAMLFFLWVLFHEHSRVTGLQGKGESISFTLHYHFHPFHTHLHISRAITAESSPLHICSSQTRTGSLWFKSPERNH